MNRFLDTLIVMWVVAVFILSVLMMAQGCTSTHPDYDHNDIIPGDSETNYVGGAGE